MEKEEGETRREERGRKYLENLEPFAGRVLIITSKLLHKRRTDV